MTRTMIAACALALLAGCSDDGTDISGIYMVTSDVASMPCGTDMDVTGGDAFLKFHKEDFFGASYYTYDGCDDAAGTTCNGGGGFFPEQIDNGWKERESFASNGGSGSTTCALGYIFGTVTLTGNQIVVDVTTYGEEAMLDDSHCTSDEAEKRGTTMACESHSRITATKVGDLAP